MYHRRAVQPAAAGGRQRFTPPPAYLFCYPQTAEYTTFDPSRPKSLTNLKEGDQILRSLGMADYLSIGQCAACLVAYIVICRIVAFIGIRFIKW